MKVHAGAFNARWNNARYREIDGNAAQGKPYPEYWEGTVHAFLQRSSAQLDRWHVKYDAGDETSDQRGGLPHVTKEWLREWLVGVFPEATAPSPARNPVGTRGGTQGVGRGVGTSGGTQEEQVIAEGEADSDSEEEADENLDDLDDLEEGETFDISLGGKAYRVQYPAEHANVIHDQRAKAGFTPETPSPAFKMDRGVMDAELESTDFLKYYLLYFPQGMLKLMVDQIGKDGRAKWGTRFLRGGRAFTKGLFISWLTCWIYMLLYPGLPRAQYWDLPDATQDIIGHDLGRRSHLSRNEFERILQVFSLPQYKSGSPYSSADCHGNCGPPLGTVSPDPFQSIRRFIDACNEQWSKVLKPGWLLTIDESMIKWLSRYRMPGWMCVGRKPDSIGHELKTLCCAITKVLFKMELQEGKELDRQKKYVKEFGAQAGLTLRMLEAFSGTAGHMVICDSWFGSVTTCIMLATMGIYSLCNVKGCHKYFPKKRLLESLKDVAVGDHVCLPFDLQIEGKTVTFYAVAHKGPGELSFFIELFSSSFFIEFFLIGWMTKKRLKKLGWPADMKGVPLLLICCGSNTTPGNLRKYSSHRPDEVNHGVMYLIKKHVEQPKAVQVWRDNYHLIDGHNNKRTGVVGMHDVWRTHSWQKRDFGEIDGIMLVNGEYTWQYLDPVGRAAVADKKGGKSINTRRIFLEGVMKEGFNNPFLTDEDKSVTTLAVASVTPHDGPHRLGALANAAASSMHSAVEGGTQLSSTDMLAQTCMPIPISNTGVQERCTVRGCEVLEGKKGRRVSARTTWKCSACHMKGGRPAWVCSPHNRIECWKSHVLHKIKTGVADTPTKVMKHTKAKDSHIERGRMLSNIGIVLPLPQRLSFKST